MRKQFFAVGEGTKHALAELLAGLFPDKLASRLPQKRRPWMSEDYRMDIFGAVALALRRKKGYPEFQRKRLRIDCNQQGCWISASKP